MMLKLKQNRSRVATAAVLLALRKYKIHSGGVQ